jgi:hypothetical protein
MHGDAVDVFLCPTCGEAVAPDAPDVLRKFHWVAVQGGSGYSRSGRDELVIDRQVFFHPEHFPPATGVYLDPGENPNPD